MAFQRDYLLRMIEMMGDLVAALLGKIKRKKFEEAEVQLEEIYTDYLKKDAAFFKKMSVDNMTHALLEEHNYTNDHLQILAELFFVEAEMQNAKKLLESSKEYYIKSLTLFKFIDVELKTFDQSRQDKISLIENKIKGLV